MRSLLIAVAILCCSSVHAEDYVTIFVKKDPGSVGSKLLKIAEGLEQDYIVNIYSEDSELFAADRWHEIKVENFPLLIVQRETGAYYFKISGENIKKYDSESLLKAIKACDARDRKVHGEEAQPDEVDPDIEGWLLDRWRERRNRDRDGASGDKDKDSGGWYPFKLTSNLLRWCLNFAKTLYSVIIAGCVLVGLMIIYSAFKLGIK